MTIKNMTSPRSGREVANQFLITTADGTYFQSYETTVAFRDNNGNVTLNSGVNGWNYSRTTSKYRNQFLGESLSETRQKVENGTYQLADLNAA